MVNGIMGCHLVSKRGSFRSACVAFQPRSGIRPPNYKETMRRFYTGPHRFCAAIDLQARSMHVCMLDTAGTVVYDRKLPCHSRPCATRRGERMIF
jgi:hypothetical protein